LGTDYQEQHFPTKSANACRKRYEVLMTKRKRIDWDEDRVERLAKCYRDMRPDVWGPMASRLNEKWEHVEKAVGSPFKASFAIILTYSSACNMG